MSTSTHTFYFPTTVLHNVTTDADGGHPAWLRGYADGDSMETVFTYGSWGPNANQDDPYDPALVAAALSEAFELCNIYGDPMYVDHPCHATALRYRLGRNRSLSKGDAVMLGERFYVVESLGWAELLPGGERRLIDA